MKLRWTKSISFFTLVALLPLACGLGIGGDPDALVGKWEMTNISSFYSEDDLGITEEDMEFVTIEAHFTFNSDGNYVFELSFDIDFVSIFVDDLANESVEIIAEPYNMVIASGGTYTTPFNGVLQLNLDPNSFSHSTPEYCITVAGEEICNDMSDLGEGFEPSDFDLGSMSYEIDGATMKLGNNDCEQPSDTPCTLNLTKVE